MFLIAQSQSYSWPVTVKIASDGGRFTESTFDAQFRRLSQAEIEALRNNITDPNYSPRDTAKQVICGWTGVSDANGDVPFSATALESLLNFPGLAAAIVIAYFDSVNGVVRKN